MCHAVDPAGGLHALHPSVGSVGHQVAPLAAVATVVRNVHAVHHVILVAVDVLVAEAVRVVQLVEHRLAVRVRFLVEGFAVTFHAANGRAVRVHRVLHAYLRRAAGRACVGVLTRAALHLAVSPPILGKKQVGDVVVHQAVYLLHTSLGRVEVEVSPRHARCCRAAGDTGSQFVPDHAAAHYGAQVGLHLHPVGFHVLYLRAVAQHHHVKLRSLQNREVQGNGICRNVGYQVHAGNELRAERAHHYRAHYETS